MLLAFREIENIIGDEKMTIEQNKYWLEGRDLYRHMMKLKSKKNGNAGLRFTQEDVKMLSKNVDLNIPYINKCITMFLEN
jgi:hypothetical protein